MVKPQVFLVRLDEIRVTGNKIIRKYQKLISLELRKFIKIASPVRLAI